MGIEANNEKNLDQPSLISEDFTLPSYNFSDACFSIDITKSIRIDDNTIEASREVLNHQVQIPGSKETSTVAKRESCDFGKREFKRELSLAPWTGIPSPVWEELGQGNKNRNLTATNDGMPLKNRTTKAENVNLRRPFWSKILVCF
ncbi:uncharacterized protein LOC110011917 [Sesamum indicum]|uniref:Uncharacterized protein LOC110011917 n=1 Tax=Sesamum indicum TaxID=4182 RepID=A0A8M8UQL7_SESIN|nr:uncharacterized protein LOC110011917 [Sesamum indicum]